MHNPRILTPEELEYATSPEILRAFYQYVVASVSFFVACVICYFVFKTLVWFLPKYWYRSSERDVK